MAEEGDWVWWAPKTAGRVLGYQLVNVRWNLWAKVAVITASRPPCESQELSRLGRAGGDGLDTDRLGDVTGEPY